MSPNLRQALSALMGLIVAVIVVVYMDKKTSCDPSSASQLVQPDKSSVELVEKPDPAIPVVAPAPAPAPEPPKMPDPPPAPQPPKRLILEYSTTEPHGLSGEESFVFEIYYDKEEMQHFLLFYVNKSGLGPQLVPYPRNR